MLDARYVTENLDEVREALAKRGFVEEDTLKRLTELSTARRSSLAEIESLRADRNQASQEMGKLDKKSPEFAERRGSLRELGDRIKELEHGLKETEHALTDLLLHLPNLPHPSTPEGRSEHDNQVVRTWGDKPSLGFEPRDHVDLGQALDVLDFERAAKLSGSRFVVLKGLAARMERALMQFMLDLHADKHGYREAWPPLLVKDQTMMGTTQLPKFAKDAFKIHRDEEWASENEAHYDLYLIPTAEVSLTNLHADEILELESLPVTYTAYTPCFRSEAGSYGRDTRGMIRQHQFDKVELVRFATPETAEDELETLVSHAEKVLQELGLHYRVSALCAGDLGFGSQKTYDLEVWLPSQEAYREISSCSWFGDFQARRMKCRYRPGEKQKPRLVHTLNGSALAIGRTLVAIFEQYQQEDGSIRVPDVLVPYMGGHKVIPASTH